MIAVIPRTLVLLSLAAGLAVFPTLVSGQRPAATSRPNLEGIWNSATATPIERPRELKDKPFFTPDEAAAWERQIAKQNEEPPPGTATRAGTGTYNTFYRECGHAASSRRCAPRSSPTRPTAAFRRSRRRPPRSSGGGSSG